MDQNIIQNKNINLFLISGSILKIQRNRFFTPNLLICQSKLKFQLLN